VLCCSLVTLMADKSKLKDKLKDIIKQISGDIENMVGDLTVPMMIQGEGILFCYQPSTREMVKVSRGTPVYPIDEEILQDSRIMVYTYEGHIVLIDIKELIIIGFD
jgi:hypothetical protein